CEDFQRPNRRAVGGRGTNDRTHLSNNSGVWNEAGAALDFSIAPAYYQTASFRVALAVTALALLWAFYQLRVHRMESQVTIRLEAMIREHSPRMVTVFLEALRLATHI